MYLSLFATKLGMTQTFVDNKKIPVTILHIDSNLIVNKLFYSEKAQYVLQIGYGNDRISKNKSILGYFKKMNVDPKRYIQEIAVSKDFFDKVNIGDELNTDMLKEISKVNVRGISQGKGFAGVMKRHNFSGFSATHGTHEMFRHGGSIGCSSKPGHVFKGKKMPGRMGTENVTIKNLKLVKFDEEKRILFIQGGIPGNRKSFVCVSLKK